MVGTSLSIDLNAHPLHDTTNDDDDDKIGDLSELSKENMKLKDMLTIICDKYNSLQAHVDKLIQDQHLSTSNPNKRKLVDDQTGSLKRPKEQLQKSGISRVYVQADATDKSLVVKDGYEWRKYGQKLTRDNPSPRAYYKCSFANCPVKKKVQRSVDDDGVLVAIYEGEHNHTARQNQKATIQENCTCKRWLNSPMEVPKGLVEQMATFLRNDPNFTAELAAEISSKIWEYN